MEKRPVRVMIVEDQPIERQMLVDYISADPRYQLVYKIENAAYAETYCMNGSIDLILMDICTENDESGLDAAAKIKKYWPGIKIIMVTSMPECGFIDRARAAGAESFWYKSVRQAEMMEVMDRTMAGESVYPDKTPELRIGDTSSYEFTPREVDILRGLVNYNSLQEIADHLNISLDTVRFHIKHLLQKTGYRTRNMLIVAIVNKKLILPGY